jgi:hypothetical protein
MFALGASLTRLPDDGQSKQVGVRHQDQLATMLQKCKQDPELSQGKSERREQMKKLLYLLIAVSLMLALVPTMALAHTADDPLVVDLLAGQTEDIGDVKVWNDADTLYVQFVYEGPDCGFLEVHLQVDEGAFSDDILTKKGNPIPGQFEMSHKPGWCFNEHTFAFDLSDEGFEVGDDLVIAAHAALGLAETMTIVSDTSTAITEVNGTPVTANAVLANEPVGYPNCASYAPDGTGSAWDSSVNIPGAHWIWNTLNPEHPIEGDVVTFQKAFSVPGPPNGGTLYITADNGYKVTLNGVLLGSAQLGPGFPTTLKETTDTTPQAGNWGVASQGWQSVESYSLTELVSGENILVFIAANEYMWNTTDQYQGKDYYYGSWDPSGGSTNADPFPGYGIGVDNICRNPGALIFKATLDYYASGETAWGAGTRFTEDKNWATWFPYEVQPYCTNVPSVVNGSFEAPAVAHSSGWDIYDSGTTGLGWTVEWYDGSTSYGGQTRPEPAHLELHKNGNLPNTSEIPDGWQAKDGSQYAELDTDWNGHSGSLNNEPASVKIYQDLQTCPGQEYTLKFSWANRPDSRVSKLKVFWNGVQVGSEFTGSGGSSTNWHDETFTVSASATGETTTLEFIETGTPDSYGMFLDYVSVEVPTP